MGGAYALDSFNPRSRRHYSLHSPGMHVAYKVAPSPEGALLEAITRDRKATPSGNLRGSPLSTSRPSIDTAPTGRRDARLARTRTWSEADSRRGDSQLVFASRLGLPQARRYQIYSTQ